jgi:hypothetical protein
VIRKDDWAAVTPHDLEKLKAELGGTQPFQRLQWLAGLAAGEGKLAPGYDPTRAASRLRLAGQFALDEPDMRLLPARIPFRSPVGGQACLSIGGAFRRRPGRGRVDRVALHYLYDTPTTASSGTSATSAIRTRSSPAAATHPHGEAEGRRGAVPARGERVRHLRRGPFLDLDLGRAGHGDRRRAQGSDARKWSP